MIWRTTIYSIFFLGLVSLNAQEWSRGAVVVLQAAPNARVVLAGGDQSLPLGDSLPLYLPGFFSSENDNNESIFLRTSNGVDLYFEGEGFFSVDRFEGVVTGMFEDEQSRMIMNLRSGLLIIDSTGLNEASQLMVETPLGKIFGARAKWYVSVEFDPRSGIYDFTITCSEGRIRLMDNKRNRYDIFRGQRIAGAGSYQNPSIEVGELTDENLEQLSYFGELQAAIEDDAINHAALRSQMTRLERMTMTSGGRPERVQGRPAESSERPIVIDIAPKPSGITPFRGEIRPPSEYQTDLF